MLGCAIYCGYFYGAWGDVTAGARRDVVCCRDGRRGSRPLLDILRHTYSHS